MRDDIEREIFFSAFDVIRQELKSEVRAAKAVKQLDAISAKYFEDSGLFPRLWNQYMTGKMLMK